MQGKEKDFTQVLADNAGQAAYIAFLEKRLQALQAKTKYNQANNINPIESETYKKYWYQWRNDSIAMAEEKAKLLKMKRLYFGK